MGKKKKKPHLQKSKLHQEFDLDAELNHSQKYPLQDGLKVKKTAKGYEIAWQERGIQSEGKVFATKKEAERYFKIQMGK